MIKLKDKKIITDATDQLWISGKLYQKTKQYHDGSGLACKTPENLEGQATYPVNGKLYILRSDLLQEGTLRYKLAQKVEAVKPNHILITNSLENIFYVKTTEVDKEGKQLPGYVCPVTSWKGFQEILSAVPDIKPLVFSMFKNGTNKVFMAGGDKIKVTVERDGVTFEHAGSAGASQYEEIKVNNEAMENLKKARELLKRGELRDEDGNLLPAMVLDDEAEGSIFDGDPVGLVEVGEEDDEGCLNYGAFLDETEAA